ncbi:hypothetical protein KI387_033756, partial [Taxus chinensis]
MTNDRSLQGHVAIVTGASRGIRRAIAIHQGQKGAKVVINYAGNVDKAEEVASIINGEDSTVLRAITCKADVSKASEVRNLFNISEKAFEKNAHILVTAQEFSTQNVLSCVIGNPPMTRQRQWGPHYKYYQLPGKSKALIERIAKEGLLECMGEVSDVAPLVAFLIIDE